MEEKQNEEIQAKIIIEILGKPKEHIENMLKQYVEKIKKDENTQVLSAYFADSREQEGLWSTFVELDMKIKSLSHLVGFCFDYMPSSIDIISPEKLTLNQKNMSDFLNDLQAKLHQVDMVAKHMKSRSDFLSKNMNHLINNFLLLLLRSASLNLTQIEKLSGLPPKEVEKFLEALVKEKKVEKVDDKYRISRESAQS